MSAKNLVDRLTTASSGLLSMTSKPSALYHTVHDALVFIQLTHKLLDGKTWTADTAGFIADALIDLGLEIRSPCECDCNDRSWYGQQHDSACPLAGLDRE